MDNETTLPTDVYSIMQRRLMDNPASLSRQAATLDLVTMLGHAESWIVKTIRTNGLDTVFVQRVNAEGGMRLVLPPEVVAAIGRQRDALGTVVRRRGAQRAAQTRKERGIEPAFLKNPHRKGKKR
jgi:hypothetical protein